jgi:hypothetical protein
MPEIVANNTVTNTIGATKLRRIVNTRERRKLGKILMMAIAKAG